MNEFLKKVTLDDYELFYEVYGNGNNVFLCFHGNSRSAEDFKFLAAPDRKIISIHLFLHHYSTFSPSRIESGNVTIPDVEKLLIKILKKENVNQFHWIAYSQGGRFTLSLFPRFADKVKSLSLISPDGLSNTSFYSWSQRQWWARRLFKRWTRKPDELLEITKFLVRIKFLPFKMVEFMEFYTMDNDRIELGYSTWSSFRNLQPSYPSIGASIDEYTIPIQLIIGEFDQIITVKSCQKFLKKIHQPQALKVIPFGHNVFRPHIVPELYKLLDFPL